MKEKISDWQEERKIPSTDPTNQLKKLTKWYENFKIHMKEKEMVLGKKNYETYYRSARVQV